MEQGNVIENIRAIGDFAVIVDDDVHDGTVPDTSSSPHSVNVIDSIRLFLLESKIPVVCYTEIPLDVSVFNGSSLSIIDWDMTGLDEKSGAAVGVVADSILDIIEKHLSSLFSPVLIITSLSLDVIQPILDAQTWYSENRQRIMPKNKKDFMDAGVFSKKKFLEFLGTTFEGFPSLAVLSEWHQAMLSGGNQLFIEMSGLSKAWAQVLFDNFADGEKDKDLAMESKREHFGSFLSNNLLGRVNCFSFKSLENVDEKEAKRIKDDSTPKLLESIIEKSKLVYLPNVAGSATVKPDSGDLFLFRKGDSLLKDYFDDSKLSDKEEYCLLNIRAQCDFARRKGDGFPDLYCLLGRFSETASKAVAARYPLRLTKESIIDSDGLTHTFRDINGLEEDGLRCLERKLNEEDPTRNDGDFAEKTAESIVSCVMGHKSVSFKLNRVIVVPFEEIKNARKAKLLNPFLFRVQQKFSLYMVRVGVPNTPFDDLYK